jgi:hypothetical protein
MDFPNRWPQKPPTPPRLPDPVDYRRPQPLIPEPEPLAAPPAAQDVIEQQKQIAVDLWRLGKQLGSKKVGG